MGKLDGKVAIVTGASSGIGEATVHELLEAGANVVATARRTDRLAKLVEAVGSKKGQLLTIMADVRNECDCDRMVQETISKWGRVDILVNNAGVMLLGPIVGADTEDWRRMIDTNVYGLIYGTHKVLPIMQAQGAGHIVNISSTAGRTVMVNGGIYNLTKWGINAFSESLRQEVHKDKIRVSVIEPGVVATELRDHITVKEVREDIKQWAESLRQLQPEDVAAAIVYAVTQPDHVNVNEILLRPTDQFR